MVVMSAKLQALLFGVDFSLFIQKAYSVLNLVIKTFLEMEILPVSQSLGLERS